MEITYEWEIGPFDVAVVPTGLPAVDPDLNVSGWLNDVIKTIYWKLIASNEDTEAWITGSCGLNDVIILEHEESCPKFTGSEHTGLAHEMSCECPRKTDFTRFNEISKKQAINWILERNAEIEGITVEEMSNKLKMQVDAELNNKRRVTTKDAPWINSLTGI